MAHPTTGSEPGGHVGTGHSLARKLAINAHLLADLCNGAPRGSVIYESVARDPLLSTCALVERALVERFFFMFAAQNYIFHLCALVTMAGSLQLKKAFEHSKVKDGGIKKIVSS